MKVQGRSGVACIALSVCIGHTAAAWASESWDAGGGGALGAHEHGVADLTVAIEGGAVEIVLTAPTADLVGLERAVSTAQERAAVEDGVAALEAGDWFAWGGGLCERVSVEVTLPAMLGMAEAPGDAAGAEHQQPDSAHHDHDHDHDHGDDEPQHLDGMVTWKYRCDLGARLRHVDVQLFDGLALQRIRAGVVSERGQGAGDLSPSARRLSLP